MCVVDAFKFFCWVSVYGRLSRFDGEGCGREGGRIFLLLPCTVVACFVRVHVVQGLMIVLSEMLIVFPVAAQHRMILYVALI